MLVDVTYFPLYSADRVSCVTFEGGRRGRRLSSLSWNFGWLGIAIDVRNYICRCSVGTWEASCLVDSYLALPRQDYVVIAG